jgi:hypothetical protein
MSNRQKAFVNQQLVTTPELPVHLTCKTEVLKRYRISKSAFCNSVAQSYNAFVTGVLQAHCYKPRRAFAIINCKVQNLVVRVWLNLKCCLEEVSERSRNLVVYKLRVKVPTKEGPPKFKQRSRFNGSSSARRSMRVAFADAMA